MISKSERYRKVIDYFQATRPVAETELNYRTPYELLVAVILSAQCTDKRVNRITPDFFRRFPTAELLANATFDEVFQLIRSCSYPNSKTRYLLGMARTLVDEFNGEVPSDIEQLQYLPGVGRKTANVIVSVIFNLPAMAVDTHVFRVANRLGLVNNAKTPLAVERELVKNIPRHLIPQAHHWLILHGRYVCRARKPLCEECGLSNICRYYNSVHH